jgi:hypothetical protein
MAPRKPQSVARSSTKWRVQTRASATATGAGSGAFLLSILQSHVQAQGELWVKVLIYLTPTVSFAITAGLNWFLQQFDAYLVKLDQERKYHQAIREAQRTLSDAAASAESKVLAQELMDEAHRYRLANARDWLKARS